MDNKRLDIITEGRANFALAMRLACGNHRKTVAYLSGKYLLADTLMLFWTLPKPNIHGACQLPHEMTCDEATEFAWGWLQHADYGEEPDHDGSNGKGFRVFNEAWGHVNNRYEIFCAIQSLWAMYGK